MKHEEFRLERYMSQYEFSARHLLASSDCESYPMAEVVSWADDECRGLWEALWLGYTESPGLPQLRREIAGLYDGVSPDDVLEVVPEEGVLIAMTVLLEPGDHVIATHPGYQTLYGIAEALGCEVTYWEPDEEQGWRFDPAFVRRELRPSTRLIVANFPHNPTGYLPTAAEYQELLDIAAEAGAYVFSDEMYRGLERDPATRLPSAVELYDKAVTLSGMSKTYSLPGLRVGWLATRDHELSARLAAYKDYTTICASAPGEILALIGLRERERIVARNLRTISGEPRQARGLRGAEAGPPEPRPAARRQHLLRAPRRSRRRARFLPAPRRGGRRGAPPVHRVRLRRRPRALRPRARRLRRGAGGVRGVAGAPRRLIRLRDPTGRAAGLRRRPPQRSPRQYSEPSREPMNTRPFHITRRALEAAAAGERGGLLDLHREPAAVGALERAGVALLGRMPLHACTGARWRRRRRPRSCRRP